MKIFAGAGEPSGDRMLAALLQGLRTRLDFEVRGFGGPLCAEQGLRSMISMENLAVNGVTDVLARFPALLWSYTKARGELARFAPDLVLLVDYPGMNAGLARAALRRGVPVHYVAPPQLWAYQNPERRLRRLRKAWYGASLQTLFPFEMESYRPWPGPLCSGHFFAPPAPSPPSGNRLLLCPGSRAGVLGRNLPAWLARLEKARPEWNRMFAGITVLAPEGLREQARKICRGRDRVEVAGSAGTDLARAGRAIAFPGTMTLELALRRVPTSVWGIVDVPTFRMGRRLLGGGFTALPNLLLGKEVLPEWVGTAADFEREPPMLPEAIAAISDADSTLLWEKMGPSAGAETGVQACVEMLNSRSGSA